MNGRQNIIIHIRGTSPKSDTAFLATPPPPFLGLWTLEGRFAAWGFEFIDLDVAVDLGLGEVWVRV